jgi:hypothetical protein
VEDVSLNDSVILPDPGNASRVNEGIYVITQEDGQQYVGQSGNIDKRMAQHVANEKFTQAEVDAAQRTFVPGGKTNREVAEQLQVDDLGGIDNLINERNPVGPARFGLMPDGYTRSR